MGPLEKDSEFDPASCTAEFVTAEVDEPISVVLERIEAALGRTPNVVVILPRRSYAFHSTHDFLALGKLHSGREVRIAIATPDPTISSLARVLGFHTQPLPPGHPYLDQPPPTEDELTLEGIEKPTKPLPLSELREAQEWIVSQSGVKYPPSSTTSTWLNYADGAASRGAAAFIEGEHEPRPQSAIEPQPHSRSGVPPPRRRPRQTGHLQLQPTIITDPSLPSITGDRFTPAPPLVSTTESGRIKARRVEDEAEAYQRLEKQEGVRTYRRKVVRRIITGVLVVMLLALAGGALYAYTYLPEATVEVTALDRQLDPIPVQVPVIVAPAPAQSSVGTGTAFSQDTVTTRTVQGTQLTAQIVQEGTAPATGSRTVPKGKAHGTIIFTNSTPYPVTVAAGTTFKAANGVTVEITQGGVVPATIFAPGSTVSSAEFEVAATVEGPDGNVPAKQLQGLYKGLTYVNNRALEGGSTETLKVVTQQDVDTLVADLTAKATDKAAAMALIGGKVADGDQLIAQTVQIAPPTVEKDHEANQDGESVHVKVSTSVSGYSFKKSDVADAVKQAMFDWVQTKEPVTAGPSLEPASIRFDTPAVVSVDAQAGRVIFGASATGKVDYSLTPTLKNQLLDLLKGKPIAQARSQIAQQYGRYVRVDGIQSEVLGFSLDHLPSDLARITVESGK